MKRLQAQISRTCVRETRDIRESGRLALKNKAEEETSLLREKEKEKEGRELSSWNLQ